MIKQTVSFFSLLSLGLVGCVTAQPTQQLKVTVVDELSAPIEGAEVAVRFRDYRNDEVKTELTDEDGGVRISASAPLPPNITVNKEGYYESHLEKIDILTAENLGSPLVNKSVEIMLRRQLDARPLAARNLIEVQIPLKDEWVGYDLETGDWVEPHGKGENTDLLFRYSNEFLGYRLSEKKLEKLKKMKVDEPDWTEEKQKFFYGNWSGLLEINFPGEKEGIIAITESNGYLSESELRMPHLAPLDGYKNSFELEHTTNTARPAGSFGYFLRLRVRERNDQILEANYAKINLHQYGGVNEGLRFDPRGKVSFSYYFNPDVNDRNLEFDPSKNLLNLDPRGQEVRLP